MANEVIPTTLLTIVILNSPREKVMQHTHFINYFISGVLLIGLSSTTNASLMGFEQSQGYGPFLNRVETYAAGTLPYNLTTIPTNSGQWKRTDPTVGGDISYATGHQNFDRTFRNGPGGNSSDQGLVLTTNDKGWSGPALKYTYDLDTQDLGVNPLSTGASVVDFSFWWCAQLFGSEFPGAQTPEGYFGNEISFLDSDGNIGFQLGLTQRGSSDKVTYWDGNGPGNDLFESSIVAASHKFDRWDISLDLKNNKFSADYFSFGTNTLHALATNASMMGNMNNFTGLSFRTSPGVENLKLLALDDFSFSVTSVPEPATITLITCAFIGFVFSQKRLIA